jgi:hypothetical protein
MESVAAIIEALEEAHVYLRIVKQRLRKGDLARLTPQISSSIAVNSDVANSDVAQLFMSIAEHEEREVLVLAEEAPLDERERNDLVRLATLADAEVDLVKGHEILQKMGSVGALLRYHPTWV